MLFPFLRCNKCNWIPQGVFRTKAIQFARKYIRKHPRKKEQLTIILEEEARETLRKIREDKGDMNENNTTDSPRMDLIILGVIMIGFMTIIIGFTTGTGAFQGILIILGMLAVLSIVALLLIKNQNDKKKKKRSK